MVSSPPRDPRLASRSRTEHPHITPVSKQSDAPRLDPRRKGVLSPSQSKRGPSSPPGNVPPAKKPLNDSDSRHRQGQNRNDGSSSEKRSAVHNDAKGKGPASHSQARPSSCPNISEGSRGTEIDYLNASRTRNMQRKDSANVPSLDLVQSSTNDPASVDRLKDVSMTGGDAFEAVMAFAQQTALLMASQTNNNQSKARLMQSTKEYDSMKPYFADFAPIAEQKTRAKDKAEAEVALAQQDLDNQTKALQPLAHRVANMFWSHGVLPQAEAVAQNSASPAEYISRAEHEVLIERYDKVCQEVKALRESCFTGHVTLDNCIKIIASLSGENDKLKTCFEQYKTAQSQELQKEIGGILQDVGELVETTRLSEHENLKIQIAQLKGDLVKQDGIQQQVVSRITEIKDAMRTFPDQVRKTAATIQAGESKRATSGKIEKSLDKLNNEVVELRQTLTKHGEDTTGLRSTLTLVQDSLNPVEGNLARLNKASDDVQTRLEHEAKVHEEENKRWDESKFVMLELRRALRELGERFNKLQQSQRAGLPLQTIPNGANAFRPVLPSKPGENTGPKGNGGNESEMIELKQSVEAVKEILSQHNTMFNNLTTDGLAEKMLNQLERVYYNPKAVRIDMDNTNRRVEIVDNLVKGVSNNFDAFTAHVNQLFARMEEFQNTTTANISESATRLDLLNKGIERHDAAVSRGEDAISDLQKGVMDVQRDVCVLQGRANREEEESPTGAGG